MKIKDIPNDKFFRLALIAVTIILPTMAIIFLKLSGEVKDPSLYYIIAGLTVLCVTLCLIVEKKM